MRYLLDVLIEENDVIEIKRQWLEVEANSEEEAQDKAIVQLAKEHPKAVIAVSTFATHDPAFGD